MTQGLTDEQKIDRMEYIVSSPEFMPEFEMNHKQDALGLIRELASTAKEISLRTLIQVTKIRSCNDDWKEMAEYLLCE